MRVKWLRGNGVGSFSSPHPRCSLFDMAADPETETNLTSFPVNLKLSWARSGEQAGKKATTKNIAGKLSGTEKA